MRIFPVALALALFTPMASFADSYEVDAVHSTAGFSIKHLMISTVHGKFDKFSGTAEIDEKNPANDKLHVEIDVSSVDTGNEKRDGHLKSPDFFDVAKFPKITFVSKSAKAAGPGKIEVTGDLTLHGVTKSVVLVVADMSPEIVSGLDKKTHRGATATATINRQDFGMKWNAPVTSKVGDVALSDEVKIQIDVELTKKTS
jgi:polyisoprenoid-binding protein YceI